MKRYKTAVWMMAAMLAVSGIAGAALTLTDLPSGYMSQWAGKSTFYVQVGQNSYLHGTIEFAVYDTQSISSLGFSAPGNRRYIYAYQVFNTGQYTNAALSHFGLTGIKPDAIEDTDDIDTASVANGINATEKGFNLAKDKAIFKFGSDGAGILLKDKKSFILLLGSDAAPIVGGYEVQASPDDDLPVPGGDTGDTPPVPEPATLALLVGGAAMCLRKRRA